MFRLGISRSLSGPTLLATASTAYTYPYGRQAPNSIFSRSAFDSRPISDRIRDMPVIQQVLGHRSKRSKWAEIWSNIVSADIDQWMKCVCESEKEAVLLQSTLHQRSRRVKKTDKWRVQTSLEDKTVFFRRISVCESLATCDSLSTEKQSSTICQGEDSGQG